MKAHKINTENSLKFILAGNAKVTFKNSGTGNRYTFQVKKNHKSKKPMHWVRVLTGSDSYSYMGTLYDGRNFKLTKASKITKEATSYKVFIYVMKHLITGTLPEQIEIWHEGTCGRCGRTLTVPESIEIGLGPICANLEGVMVKKSIITQNILQHSEPIVVEEEVTKTSSSVVTALINYYPTFQENVEFIVGDKGELISEMSDCGMSAKYLHEYGIPGSLYLSIDGKTSIVSYKRQEMAPNGEDMAAFHYAGPNHNLILFND